MNNNDPVGELFGFISGAIKGVVFFAILTLGSILTYSTLRANDSIDDRIDQTLSIVNSKYTASFINSGQYNYEKNRYYDTTCHDEYSNGEYCTNADVPTHREYINDRYDSIYDRVAWVEAGKPFELKRFLFVF